MIKATTIGVGIGGAVGAGVGATHGLIKGGLSGAVAGAWNGLLWGAAAGASIGAGGYALGSYFAATSTLPVVSCYGAATLVAGTPWRIAASISLAHAIKSGDPVDISFASLGFILGYLPATEGTQFNAFIGAYFRGLPFVRNFRVISSKAANADTGGGYWEPAYATWRWAGEFETAKTVRFVRLFKLGESNHEGGFLVLESEVIGLSGAQMQQRIASNFVPDAYQVVDVRAGTTLRIGQVGPQPNLPNAPPTTQNGGLQFQFVEEVPSNWFSDPRPIGAHFQGIE